MCGIAGFFDPQSTFPAERHLSTLKAMTDAIRHRGPDDEGHWLAPDARVALGHRRLSIVDLSPAGHQPMASHDGRYTMVFNGEVYNFQALRQELEGLGHTFRGHSDTEVMLAACVQWGAEAALPRFNGMFAFALWDAKEHTLILARDRLGKKPLYYGWMGGVLLFGSELKALRAHPLWQGVLNRQALTLYLRHNYIPAPWSIYQGVFKLPQASFVRFATVSGQPLPCPIPYWSAQQAAEQGVAQPFAGSEAQALDELERLLMDAVKLRMVSDVPLGAFLSGGIDSTVVVALMQAQSRQKVRTFSIGFHEEHYNEAQHAKVVAAHLGTDHTELYVTSQQALDVIPKLPHMFDEPFADSSQVPTFLVSHMARQHVTVALSGDGGDELFCGYTRYTQGQRIWGALNRVPLPLRHLAARMMLQVSPAAWNQVFRWAGPLVPAGLRQQNPGDKMHKLAKVLGYSTGEAFYLSLISHWEQPAKLVVGGEEPPTLLSDPARWAHLPQFVQRMMYLDMVTYLPDDILVKVDRASMGVSLEARAPLLDYRVAEFAWRLPMSLKQRDGISKWLLRQLLYRHVPRDLMERPKMGFGVPIDQWLRGPLRDWAENLLDETRLRNQGYLQPAPIRQFWQEHLSGRRNWQYHLWDVLMFQAWLDQESAISG